MAPEFQASARQKIITLLTDFGHQDAYVGLMKGVILAINREVHLVDLTHAVPSQDIMRAALILRHAVAYFPQGTIHVAVVDPGVGSERRPLLVSTPGGFLIGPDNGVLSLAANDLGAWSAYVLDQERFFRHPVSQTFHGRDIFAPIAAHASLGVAPTDLGTAVDSITELQVPRPHAAHDVVRGEVVYVDRFGNLVTNIDSASLSVFRGRALSINIGVITVAGPMAAYTSVEDGALLGIIGSWGMLEIASRNGNAAEKLKAGPGTQVTVTTREPRA